MGQDFVLCRPEDLGIKAQAVVADVVIPDEEMKTIYAAIGRETLETQLGRALKGLSTDGEFYSHMQFGFRFRLKMSNGGVKVTVEPFRQEKSCGELYGIFDTCGLASEHAVSLHVERRKAELRSKVDMRAVAIKKDIENISRDRVSRALLDILDSNLTKGHFWGASGFAFRLVLSAGISGTLRIAVENGTKTNYFDSVETACTYATKKYQDDVAEADAKKKAEEAQRKAQAVQYPFAIAVVQEAMKTADRYEVDGYMLRKADKAFAVSTPNETGHGTATFPDLVSACIWVSGLHARTARTTYERQPASGEEDLPYYKRVELNCGLPVDGIRRVIEGAGANPRWNSFGFEFYRGGVDAQSRRVYVARENDGWSIAHFSLEEVVKQVRIAVADRMRAELRHAVTKG